MNTWIYKGNKKADTYLYLPEKDNFSEIPEALLTLLGELEFVMEVDLFEGRKLAQADINDVREKLVSQRYYLQLPPGDFQGKTLC